MASIFKRPDSVFWFAAYRASDGRRVKVCTKTENKAEAQRIADRLELEARESKATRRDGVSLSGLNTVLQKATQLAVSGRLDAEAARGIVNEILAAAGGQGVNVTTHRALCDAFLASKKGAIKVRSSDKYDQICRDWLAFLGTKAEKPLDSITKADAVAYRDRLAKEGRAAGTVNHMMKVIVSIYGEAVEQGHLGRNPFAGVDGLREKAEDTKREPFTGQEVAKLIAAAEGDWRGLVIVAATTGLRMLDAARLKWSNLDLEASLIRVKTTKTGASLTLPIHPAFAEWLATQRRGIAAAPVFPALASVPGPGKYGLSMTFKGLMEKAGVVAGVARAGKGKGRTFSQKSFHSLRHFAVSQMAASGVRAEIAMQITGHADAAAHAGYVSADIDAMRKAVEGIKLG